MTETNAEPGRPTGEAPPYTGACPRCGGPLTGSAPGCPRCHLDLVDPRVSELSDLNRRHQMVTQHRAETLRSLDGELAAITDRRHQVLRALQEPRVGASAPAAHSRATTAGSDTNGWGTQMLLLALGVLCLTIAAAVFAAVGWDRLNQWGQAGVLLATTAAAGFGGVALFRRGLRATGEAVLALGGVMVLVDVATFGSALGAGTGDLRFWSVGLALLSGLGAVSRRWGGPGVGPRPNAGGIIAAVAAQFPLPLAVLALLGTSSTSFDLTLWDPRPTQPGIAGVAVVLIVQALAVALAARERRWSLASPVVTAGLLATACGWLAAVGLSLALAQPTAIAAILAGAALAAAVAAPLPQLDTVGASTVAGAASVAFLGAWVALAPAEPSLTIWIAAGAALTLGASRPLSARYSMGPATVAALALLGCGWVLAAAGVHALNRFAEIVLNTSPSGTAPSEFSWVDVGVVASVAAAAITLGRPGAGPARPILPQRTLPTALGLSLYLAMVGPAMLGATAVAWAGVLAATAAAAAVAAVLSRPGTPTWGIGWSVVAASIPASLLLAHELPPLALSWLVVLTVTTLTAAAWLGGLGRATEAAALTSAGTLTAVVAAGYTAWLAGAGGAWIGVTATVSAGVIAAVAVAMAELAGDPAALDRASAVTDEPVGPLPPWARALAGLAAVVSLSVQGVATIVATAASIDLGLAGPGTAALLSGAVTWFAVAAISNRAWAAGLGGVHSQLAAWLLLGIADVSLVEAYTVPGALALLVIGVWWMVTHPTVDSWSALAPALALGLVPSTIAALADGAPRSLWVVAAAGLIVAAGALARMASPVVIGATGLVLTAAVEVAPLVGALPRYLTFGFAGALLLLLGATFEQRRADLAALNRQLRALR